MFSVTAKEIEERYPFKNLPPKWIGLFAPDNGVINVQLLLRSLLSLAKDYGAEAKQHTRVERIIPSTTDKTIWEVHAISHDTDPALFKAKKIVIASGAYVNPRPTTQLRRLPRSRHLGNGRLILQHQPRTQRHHLP